MSNLINLTFENTNPIRIIDQNGDFWFVANDVCNILEIQNTTQALQSLDDDEKAKIDTTSSPMFNIALDNRVKEINIINESGLYALILRSRKAMQKGTVQHKFRKWVTSEVLPSIRKTGSYRHTISIEQQAQIRQAVAKRCQSNSTHYQSIYTALHHKFGIPRYDELLACDFDEALVFITDFKLADDVSEYNALWKLIGLLEYERIDNEIRELKRTIDTAYQQIERISRTKGLIYDAISEQRTSCPHNIHRLNEAKAFIARQMAMKQQLI